MIRREDLQDRAARAPLTPRQAEVLDHVSRYYALTGEPASASYVARRVRVSHVAIRRHFAILHAKGYLRSSASPTIPT